MAPSFDFRQPYPSRRSPVMAGNVVSTSQPLAAQAGLRMLLEGGNAVDAALAAAMALTVVEPTGNGLGSDAFCILWDGQRLEGLNASGRSPAAWTPERFAGRDAMPQFGWESVTVPGAVSAWVALSERYGRLPFERLFGPAIGYAADGYLVSPIVAELWRRGAETLGGQPGFAEAFLPDGRAPRAGERFVNGPQAESLQAIADSRGEAFYRGALAERIASFADRHGAALTADDLAAHRPDWCGTISKGFGDLDLHEIPPNGQGIAALMALGMCRHLGLDGMDPDGADALHLQIEAMKLALVDARAYVGDLDAMTEVGPQALLDDGYLAERAKAIDPKAASDPGAGAPKQGGTVYISAADERGMMVSLIQSNYSGFGSGVVVPGTGISLQNRGFGFTLQEGHQNRVGPRKRPFHTIIPGFLMDGGRPAMSFGVMGGPIQAQGHLQMVLRTRLWGQNPQAASDAPRWRFVAGRDVAMEYGFPEETVSELRRRGHQLSFEAPESAFGFGGAQLIHAIDGGYVAGSDHRKDGCAVGY